MRNTIRVIFWLLAGITEARQLRRDEEQPQVKFIRKKVEQHGFKFETHEVTTDDGYILQVLRLYSDEKISKKDDANEPVLMWHGLF